MGLDPLSEGAGTGRISSSAVAKAMLVLATVGLLTPLFLLLSKWLPATFIALLILTAVFACGWVLGRASGFTIGLLLFVALNILSFYEIGPQIFPPPSPQRFIGMLVLPLLGVIAGYLHEMRTRLKQKAAEQEKLVEQLEQTGSRLELMLESLPVVSYNCEAGGDFAATFISGNVVNMTGFTPEQFTSDPSFRAERIHPEDAQRVFDDLSVLFDRGSHQHEYRWRVADGSYRWFFDSLRLVSSGDGESDYVVGIWQDVTDRKRTEEVVERHEKLYRDAIAAADAVAYQRDFQTNQYMHMDLGIEKLIGYSRDEMRPDIWPRIATDSIMFGEAQGLPESEADRRLRGGELGVWKADYKVRHKDGQTRWLSDSSVPITDAQGNVTGSLGILQDATDRKRVEDSLRLTQFAIDHAADAACWVDPQANILYVNEEACRSLGYSRQELLGMSVHDVDPNMSKEAWLGVWEELKRGGKMTMETAHHAKDGRVFPVDVSTNYLLHNGVEYACSFCRDITQRKANEETLRQSEERFRDLIEGSLQGISIHRDHKPLFVNEAMARMHGYTVDEILAMESSIELIAPHERQRTIGYRDARMAGRPAPSHYEYQGVRKDGSLVWLENLVTVIRWDGELAIQTSTFDITARKAADEQARKHLAELAHVTRLATLGEMVTGMAHELNQPLTAVANSAHSCEQILQAAAPATPETGKLQQLTKRISEQAHRAGRIIRRLRDLTRKSDPTRGQVEVGRLVDEVVELMSPDARRLGIALEFKSADRLDDVLVDRIQIEQVLINLVKNAFDELAELDNGRPTVTITIDASGGDAVRITVADNGPSIVGTDMERLFEPFYTTKEKGMGMGLAISRSIVEAHEGTFRATANRDGGATFSFTLPVAP